VEETLDNFLFLSFLRSASADGERGEGRESEEDVMIVRLMWVISLSLRSWAGLECCSWLLFFGRSVNAAVEVRDV